MQTDQHPIQHLPASQVGRRILRATGALMLIQIVLRSFGFIEKMLLSMYCTGVQADAFFAARKMTEPIRMLGEQVIMHSFLPTFVQRMREDGEKAAWRMASTTINLMVMLMAIVTVAGLLFTDALMHLYIKDWLVEHPEMVSSIRLLTRVMLVAMVFLATSALTYCLLNSYKQFALPASADMVLKFTVLVFAIVMGGKWGALALVTGFVLGAIAKLAVQAIGLGKLFRHYQPVVDVHDASLAKFGLLALPLVIGLVFSSLRSLMDTKFVTALGGGNLTAVEFARTLPDLLVNFFPYAFGIALFPFLADIAAAKDTVRLREMLMTATRVMVLIFAPLALCIFLLHAHIAGIFHSEKFTADSVALMYGPLQLYALGMLIGALEIIVLQFFFAMSDTLRPTIIGMAMVPLHIGIAYLGIHYWGFGAAAIAFAYLCSKGTKVLVLYGMIRRKFTSLEGARTLALLGKVLLALLPLGVLLWTATTYLPQLMPTTLEAEGKAAKLLALAPYGVAGGIGIMLYLALLHGLRVEELTLLLQRIRRKVSKGGTPPTASPDRA